MHEDTARTSPRSRRGVPNRGLARFLASQWKCPLVPGGPRGPKCRFLGCESYYKQLQSRGFQIGSRHQTCESYYKRAWVFHVQAALIRLNPKITGRSRRGPMCQFWGCESYYKQLRDKGFQIEDISKGGSKYGTPLTLEPFLEPPPGTE